MFWNYIYKKCNFEPLCFLIKCVKVEKILKGSLDLIPSFSTSVNIQIMSMKVCLRCKGKTFENKKIVDIAQ